MTLRPRAIAAVVRARTRLRDLAAAHEARALSEHTDADSAATRAASDFEAAVTDAGSRLASSVSVIDLCRIADDLGSERAAMADADVARTATAAAHERAASELRHRERQRRTVERALENLYEARDRGEVRDEQRLNDDLGGRRRSA